MPKVLTPIEKVEKETGFDKEDVLQIADFLKKEFKKRKLSHELTDEQIIDVLKDLPHEAEIDPTGDWTLWTENILYYKMDEWKA